MVAIVPWERPGAPAMARLWATARATTFESDRFFESLPDGPIAPALRFAFASELLASAAMALLALAPAALIAPRWVKHVLIDEAPAAARLAAVGVPALATILVAAHVVHGWALDRGARRSGVRGATTRALRFGLYATGWDLVVGPLGALVVAAKEGLGKALSLGVVIMDLPGRSSRAFLRGCYRLDGAGGRACAAGVVRCGCRGHGRRGRRGHRGARGRAAALRGLRRPGRAEHEVAGSVAMALRARRDPSVADDLAVRAHSHESPGLGAFLHHEQTRGAPPSCAPRSSVSSTSIAPSAKVPPASVPARARLVRPDHGVEAALRDPPTGIDR